MLQSLPAYWFDKTAKTQRRSTALDTGGGVVATYADYLTGQQVRLVVGKGGENGSQDRLSSQSPFRIYFSGAPDVKATDRVVFSSRVFDITNVNDFDAAAVYTRADATEVSPSGVGA